MVTKEQRGVIDSLTGSERSKYIEFTLGIVEPEVEPKKTATKTVGRYKKKGNK